MTKGSSHRAGHGGIAPFGYKWVGGRLLLDAAEAPVRALIFDLFLKHRRKKVVARMLNELGHRTRTGSLFSDTTVARLLSDPIVKGRQDPALEGFNLEPLIDEELWKKTQVLLGDRPNKQTSRLFTGLAYCECGAKMLVLSGSSKYSCRTCRRKIEESDLEEIIHTKLRDTSIFETTELFDRWYGLSANDRRLITEHICDRIVVGKELITMEIGYSPTLSAPDADEAADDAGDRPEHGPLLSEAQAAKFLGVSKMTLLRKRHAAEISFFRVGARILYSKEKHLLPYLSKNEKAHS